MEVEYFIMDVYRVVIALNMRSALIFEERIVTVVKYIFMQFNFELLW
jgi:hypothetical protein